MTLYLNDKKYKLTISDEGNEVILKLFKRRFRIYYKCICVHEVILDPNYTFDVPRPSLRYITLSGPRRFASVDNRKNVTENMILYLNKLIDLSFEIDLLGENIDELNYKSQIREQRLNKILK